MINGLALERVVFDTISLEISVSNLKPLHMTPPGPKYMGLSDFKGLRGLF